MYPHTILLVKAPRSSTQWGYGSRRRRSVAVATAAAVAAGGDGAGVGPRCGHCGAFGHVSNKYGVPAWAPLHTLLGRRRVPGRGGWSYDTTVYDFVGSALQCLPFRTSSGR